MHQTKFQFSGTQCELVGSVGSVLWAAEWQRIAGSGWGWLGGRWNKCPVWPPNLADSMPRRSESGCSGAQGTAGGERPWRSLLAPSSFIHTVGGLILHFYLQSFKSPLSPNIKQSRRPGGEGRRGGGGGRILAHPVKMPHCSCCGDFFLLPLVHIVALVAVYTHSPAENRRGLEENEFWGSAEHQRA